MSRGDPRAAVPWACRSNSWGPGEQLDRLGRGSVGFKPLPVERLMADHSGRKVAAQ